MISIRCIKLILCRWCTAIDIIVAAPVHFNISLWIVHNLCMVCIVNNVYHVHTLFILFTIHKERILKEPFSPSRKEHERLLPCQQTSYWTHVIYQAGQNACQQKCLHLYTVAISNLKAVDPPWEVMKEVLLQQRKGPPVSCEMGNTLFKANGAGRKKKGAGGRTVEKECCYFGYSLG